MDKTLRFRAYGKVNLGLEVLGLRPDGYHEVLTVLQTVSLSDDLVFEPARSLSVISNHPAVPRDERNLVIRAGKALQKRFGIRKGARIAIRKRLPVGGGMGGGSSDAACALVGLSELWGLDQDELEEMAPELGSDVPFFLKGGTCLGKGRGEILEALPSLSPCFLALALPGFGVSTAWAYRKLGKEAGGPGGLTNPGECIKIMISFLESGDIQGLARSLFNRLEEAVFSSYPELAGLKEDLLRLGALGALLSGSGSTVFGLYREEGEARDAGSQLGSLPRGGGLGREVVQPVPRGWERVEETSELG